MKRNLVCLCLFLTASLAQAEDSLFKSVWPFQKAPDTAEKSFDTVNPFVGSNTTASKDKKLFEMPSFGKRSPKAKAKSESMFSKTRKTWSGGLQGVQGFGKQLNPFAGKAKKKPNKKKSPSFLARLFPPKEPVAPATVGEFLSMKRP